MTQSPSDYILNTSREYSIYVCESRAIPKVTDGLKDGQRKALWLLRTRADKIKTVSLSGEMISSGLYLHGDASASNTISLMAAPYCNNIPLIKGIGTFGTRVAPGIEGIGAPRYTYVKCSTSTQELVLTDLELVPERENYDGSTMEPETFLPIIPLVLLNSVSGIAVGWSTEILPRKLDDLITATIAAIEGRKPRKIKPHYSYLDLDVEDLKNNKWKFSGKIERVDSSTCRITELPPDLKLEAFKDRLLKYEDDKKITDWTDSSSEKIDIEVKFKRGTIKDWTDEKLIEFFKLYKQKTERIVVLDWDGKCIRQYDSAEELVTDFVEWRFGYYIKRYERLLKIAQDDLKFFLAVKECFDQNLPSQIKSCANKKAVVDLIEQTVSNITDNADHYEKIATFPTYKWTVDEYKKTENIINDLITQIADYERLLDDPELILDIYKQEVLALKKVKFDQ